MQTSDSILFRELPLIRKIIQDETWLEGERRGCQVRPDDRVVRDNVCQIVLRVGQQLRESVIASIAKPEVPSTQAALDTPSSVTSLPVPNKAA